MGFQAKNFKIRSRRALVYKLDGGSRNKYENVVRKKTLKDNGVKLAFCMENISNTLYR